MVLNATFNNILVIIVADSFIGGGTIYFLKGSILGLRLWCLTLLSTIFQLYRCISFIGGGMLYFFKGQHVRARVWVFNATFNNISFIWWQYISYFHIENKITNNKSCWST